MAPFRWPIVSVCGNEPALLIVDREGERVWFLAGTPGEQVADVQPAESGPGLLYNVFDEAHEKDIGRIERVALDGTSLGTVETPLAHHVFAQDGDGLAWLTVDVRRWYDPDRGEDIDVVGDAIVELPGGVGEPVRVWTTWDDFSPFGGLGEPAFSPFGADWTHANTLHPIPEHGTWMTGLAHLGMVLEIDRETGELVRQYGGPGGYFIPTPSFPIEHPHDAHLTEEGNLLLMSSVFSLHESRAVEYEKSTRSAASCARCGATGATPGCSPTPLGRWSGSTTGTPW